MMNKLNKNLEVIEHVIFGVFCMWFAVIAFQLHNSPHFISSFSRDGLLYPVWSFLKDINQYSSWMVVVLSAIYGVLRLARAVLTFQINKTSYQ